MVATARGYAGACVRVFQGPACGRDAPAIRGGVRDQSGSASVRGSSSRTMDVARGRRPSWKTTIRGRCFGLAVLAPTAARRESREWATNGNASPAPPSRATTGTTTFRAPGSCARRPSSRSSAIRPARRWAGWNLGFAVCAQAARHLPRPAAAGDAGTRGPTVKYRERRPRTDRCPALAYPRPLRFEYIYIYKGTYGPMVWPTLIFDGGKPGRDVGIVLTPFLWQ